MAWLASVAVAPAAIIYSGVQDLNIPNNFAGIYVDFQDANDATVIQTGTTAGAVPNWDFTAFFAGAAFGNSTTFLPVVASAATNADILNLAEGTIVDGSDAYPPGFSGSTGHMGAGATQFSSGSEGWVGFSVPNSSWASNAPGFTVYGAMRVTFNDDGSDGTIHDWFWDNSGAAIAVPEPSTVVPLMAFLAPWFFLRRRGRRR